MMNNLPNNGDELILRTEAIKSMRFRNFKDIDGIPYVKITDIYKKIRNIPAYNVPKKKAKWITQTICSSCGIANDDICSFCPHCGAEMTDQID